MAWLRLRRKIVMWCVVIVWMILEKSGIIIDDIVDFITNVFKIWLSRHLSVQQIAGTWLMASSSLAVAAPAWPKIRQFWPERSAALQLLPAQCPAQATNQLTFAFRKILRCAESGVWPPPGQCRGWSSRVSTRGLQCWHQCKKCTLINTIPP